MSRARGKPEAPRLAPAERIDGARVGVVVSASPPRVEVPGVGAVEARLAAMIDDAALARAAAERQEAVLLFDGGEPRRPVLLALLRSATPHLDAVLAGPLPAAAEKVARLDGKRVILDGRDEVVLTCGRASLTLRRDGKIVLRGVNVVSEASEVQKIRGGKVQIN